MPADQGQAGGDPPLEQYQGHYNHITEENETITLTNSGHLAIGSQVNDEWCNFPWEWYYPHVCGNQQKFFNIASTYTTYRPKSCHIRLFNIQTTGQVGVNDFAGNPRNANFLLFVDNLGVTGRGLMQPPLKQKAFTELYKDNSFMTRAFNEGSVKTWDTFAAEKLHGDKIESDYIPYEGSPNIK